MRGTTTLALAVVLLAGLLVLPAAAQPPPSAPSAQVTRLTTGDSVALAAWTTCPEPAASQVTCTETFVQANSGRDGDAIVLSQVRFALDGEGAPTLLEFSNLSGPVTVSIARDLASATVSAELEGFRCQVVDPDEFEIDCQEVGPAGFSADWTATGRPQRVVDTSTPAPGAGRQDPLFIGNTRLVLRDATAGGALGGAPVPGTVVFGQLASVHGSELLVCRGGPAMQDWCAFGP